MMTNLVWKAEYYKPNRRSQGVQVKEMLIQQNGICDFIIKYLLPYIEMPFYCSRFGSALSKQWNKLSDSCIHLYEVFLRIEYTAGQPRCFFVFFFTWSSASSSQCCSLAAGIMKYCTHHNTCDILQPKSGWMHVPCVTTYWWWWSEGWKLILSKWMTHDSADGGSSLLALLLTQ